MEKFCVTGSGGKFDVIESNKDGVGGNTCITVENGFDTRESAERMAHLMNTDFQLYLDNEDALSCHDPAERMRNLGYSYVEGQWVREK